MGNDRTATRLAEEERRAGRRAGNLFGFCECGRGLSYLSDGSIRETHDASNPDCSEYAGGSK